MYKDIILHGLKVRVFGNGKSIQVFRNKSWVPLKFKESYGYPLVTLKHKSLRKHYKVSRLVVMHLNNIRTDNRAENLKGGTQKENTLLGIQEGRFYFHGGYNKISPRKIRRIIRCLRLHRYTTIRGLCQKFKISKPALYRIKKTYFL